VKPRADTFGVAQQVSVSGPTVLPEPIRASMPGCDKDASRDRCGGQGARSSDGGCRQAVTVFAAHWRRLAVLRARNTGRKCHALRTWLHFCLFSRYKSLSH
jgi:hypothetical protein